MNNGYGEASWPKGIGQTICDKPVRTVGETELDQCINRAASILNKLNDLYNDLHVTAVRLVGEAEVEQQKLLLGALEEMPQGKLHEIRFMIGAIDDRVEYIDEAVKYLSSRL